MVKWRKTKKGKGADINEGDLEGVAEFVSDSTDLGTTICQQIGIFWDCKIGKFGLHEVGYLSISLVGWNYLFDTPLSANLWKQIL